MRYFVAALATMFVAVAIPTAAFADYAYTVSVPASLSNLPAGTSVAASCAMFSGKNGAGTQLALETSSPASSPSGAYQRTFTIKLNTATAPQSYGCWLFVYSGNTMLNWSNGTPSVGWTGTMMTYVNLGS